MNFTANIAGKPKKFRETRCPLQAFLLALGIAVLIFLPFVLLGRGYFTFFGDFNVQQIPFYKLAHEAVRSGELGWNWYTDLGVNFIGSYSFYLLFSPFFWLTLPFPTAFVPYLMAPLLMLKMACAAFTSCLYLQRFVKNRSYAVIGALLYAFSGFSIYNIFFNHFHEAIVFFPLMLWGLEKLVTEDKRGFFAMAVLVNAVVNYWFFIGEVVFTILYFLLRCFSHDWRMTLKKFGWCFLEAVLGLLGAMFAFLPSVMAIMGNPRTTSDKLLSGWSFWLYSNTERYPAIFHALFFPPEVPSRPSFFPDHGAKWSSLACWLPLFSMSGVIAYLRAKKKSWLTRAIVLFTVMACIPGLNSLFILLNDSYYTRWFYMFSLLLSLATILALEGRNEEFNWSRSTVITGSIIVGTILIIGLTPKIKDGSLALGLMKYPDKFLVNSAIALFAMVLLIILVFYYRRHPKFLTFTALSLSVVCVVSGVSFIAMGKQHSDTQEMLIDTALEGRYQLQLDDTVFARSDFYQCMDNLGMFWHLPNIQAFHSVVPVSIMDFYPFVGVKRDVSSKPEAEYYQLRSLLSVRWLFVKESAEGGSPVTGFRLYSRQNGYKIYENENFLPMGFTYDSYLTRSEVETLAEGGRSMAMIYSMVLEDEDVSKCSDVLSHSTNPIPSMEYRDYVQEVEQRRQTCADSFQTTKEGFSSTITLSRENYVFYSVPYDEGWSATVNGQPAEIIKSNVGFMAVRAPAGANTITFTYTTPGLKLGTAVSAGAILILIGYTVLCSRRRRRAAVPAWQDELSETVPEAQDDSSRD